VNKESDKYESATGEGLRGGGDGPLPGVRFEPTAGPDGFRVVAPTLADDEGWEGNKRSFKFLEHLVNSAPPPLQTPRAPRVQPTQSSTGDDARDDDDDGAADDNNTALDCGRAAAAGVTPWIRLRRKIDRAVVLTILSALPDIRQAYGAANALSGPRQDGRNCFELLGYDILVTQAGRVNILEVNHSPSLFCDTSLDTAIKSRVVSDVFRLLEPHIPDVKKCGDSAYAKHQVKPLTNHLFARAERNSLFRRVYPLPMNAEDGGASSIAPGPKSADCGVKLSGEEAAYNQATMDAYSTALDVATRVFGGPAAKPVTPESQSNVLLPAARDKQQAARRESTSLLPRLSGSGSRQQAPVK
jgi:hypothetical protein